MGRGCRARAAAWATMTLGARVPGVTAVGMTHLGCPTINTVGGLHVVVGVPKIVQSGPTRASGLWRGRGSERLINTERRREVPAIERESTRERESERDTLT